MALIDLTDMSSGMEDDVAFALQLSREIHRIYSDYREARVEPTESVLAGLTVTAEALKTLRPVVPSGTACYRLSVAEAQVGEMLAVLFGRDGYKEPEADRQRYRSMVTTLS